MQVYCPASLVFNLLLKKLHVFIEYKFWLLCWQQNATDLILSLLNPVRTFPTCYSRPRFSIKLPVRLRSPEQLPSHGVSRMRAITFWNNCFRNFTWSILVLYFFIWVPVFSSFAFGALCFHYYIILLYWIKEFHVLVTQKIKLMSHSLFVFMVYTGQRR